MSREVVARHTLICLTGAICGELPRATEVSPAAQAQVTVAIIDVGVFGDHPDLAGKVVDGVDTSYAHKADSGCVEPPVPPGFPAYFTRFNLLPMDPLTGAIPCEAVEDFASVQDHGTHVAGTVAAQHLTRQETSTQFGSGLVDADRATR